MNVVIFGKGFGKPRQLNLSGLSATAVAVVCAGRSIRFRICRRLLVLDDHRLGYQHERSRTAK